MISWLVMITTKITESVITTLSIANEVKSEKAGAYVTFSGDVRNHDQGKTVRALIYEVHPTATGVLQGIAEEVFKKYEVISLSVAHRFGQIPIGESAFIASVAAAHRAPAFVCCEEIVERVKSELPIWKYQEFTDGTSEWVNSA
jgi:molybdopterin synthase catalytic subunit